MTAVLLVALGVVAGPLAGVAMTEHLRVPRARHRKS